MSITETDINELLHYGERVTLECKDASGGLPKSIWETYSAFANTVGGTILLGIKEDVDEPDWEKRFSVSHLKDPARLIKEFWDTLNSSKVSTSLLVNDDVEMIPYCGETIISIRVPQADYKKRPVFINDNPLKGTFKRNYEGDYHCTPEEVRAMLRDVNDSGNDGALVENYTMADIDPESLKAYRNEYQVKNPDHVWNALDNKEFLRNLGGLALDRNSGKEWLTVAGLLMFGKGLPIRERFDNLRLDYLDFTNLLPGSRWSDRLTYDGTWENNLYSFFRRVMPKLTQDLKRPFHLEGITRIDDTPVHKALREAMVNLIIHSDFMITGVLRVEKRDNCFVFINPGSLKLPIQAIYEGGTSKARNPRIQNMLRMLGFGETIGSGFPTILAAWQQENWRKPDLRDNYELAQVELRLWMMSLLPEECTVFLRNAFGEAYSKLSADEQKILCTARLEGEVSNNRLQGILDLHPVDIGKLLSELTAQGYLSHESKGRWTTYKINVPDKENTPQVEGNTPQVAPHVMDLLNCLGDETLSSSEIMARLGLTDRKYFRKGYLGPALDAKVIEMTIPQKPRSSKQQYRKVLSGGQGK